MLFSQSKVAHTLTTTVQNGKEHASEVGSLLQLAAVVQSQLLHTRGELVAQARHIVLSVNLTGNTLEPGPQLRRSLSPRSCWQSGALFLADPGDCCLVQHQIRELAWLHGCHVTLKYDVVCHVDSLMSRSPLKTHHASLNCSKLAFSHEPRNIQPIEPHTNPLFSHTLCVFPQNIHKNALLRRGINQGHQGATGGIKGHQLSVSQGFRGIS